jgi:hypothetical protein
MAEGDVLAGMTNPLIFNWLADVHPASTIWRILLIVPDSLEQFLWHASRTHGRARRPGLRPHGTVRFTCFKPNARRASPPRAYRPRRGPYQVPPRSTSPSFRSSPRPPSDGRKKYSWGARAPHSRHAPVSPEPHAPPPALSVRQITHRTALENHHLERLSRKQKPNVGSGVHLSMYTSWVRNTTSRSFAANAIRAVPPPTADWPHRLDA